MSDVLDDAQALEERLREAAIAQVRAAPMTDHEQLTCLSCGEPIPAARRQAVPGVKLCIGCQEDREGNG